MSLMESMAVLLRALAADEDALSSLGVFIFVDAEALLRGTVCISNR